MAPVSSDNREMMGNFKRFAESFCTSGIVKLSKSCLNRCVVCCVATFAPYSTRSISQIS